MSDVTRILNSIEGGDPKAADELLPLVYDALRRLASQRLSREPPGQTLQATALVHESYIRLVGAEAQDWKSRGHFFGAAAEAMRRILVENARRKKSLKCGGDRHRLDLEDQNILIEGLSEDLIALDEALEKLGDENHIVADLIKLRYFAGLSLEEVAKILSISPRTAARHWAFGKVWLLQEISKTDQ